ncbi:MAG: DNA repair protein RecN [Gemmatimonadota bacterium]
MITELRVRDLATIAEVTLQLGDGLNVLTGETGAGKSMLVDALGLLLGGRGDSGAVRPGASKMVVEGAFEPVSKRLQGLLEELGLDVGDDRLVVRREVSSEGRSRAWVNGSPTTVTVLGQLGGWLVDVHGQHETTSLLRADIQRDLLDSFAEAETEASATAGGFLEREGLAREQSLLLERRDAVRKKADYLRHVLQEIDAAKLRPDEEAELDRDLTRLGHAEQLRDLANRIEAAVDGDQESARSGLVAADRALGQLERIDAAATDGWRALVDQAYAAIEELARLARDYREGLDQDPGRLAELEQRRALLDKLSRKYGESVDAMLATRKEAGRELDLLDTADLDLKTIAARLASADTALREAADALSAKRKEGAERFGRAVNRLLPRLGMTGGRFEAALTPLDRITGQGQESVQFLVQLNAGLDARPVQKVASGGELSRIMLALTVALARHDATPTLVFDEIDQGVGGEVGNQVGEALAEVARRHQVLVITHLPQIAARADRHLAVAKRARSGVARSDVSAIHGEDRVAEVARMLGDSDGETARRHAVAMIQGKQGGKAAGRQGGK